VAGTLLTGHSDSVITPLAKRFAEAEAISAAIGDVVIIAKASLCSGFCLCRKVC
jgi:hypothetical protein